MVSYNEFSELNTLLCRIETEIEEFCHVSEFLPESFTQELLKLRKAIDAEIENRDL